MPDAHRESKTRRAYFIKKRQYFSYERSDKQYISRRGACEKPERNRPETPYQSWKKQVYPRRRRDRRPVPQRFTVKTEDAHTKILTLTYADVMMKNVRFFPRGKNEKESKPKT